MSWIKVRTNLHEDPRVISIAAELGIDELHAVGMLWRVWSWADEQTLDGSELNVSDAFLDRLVRRDGFSAELRKIGWLEGRKGALSFPRFAEHNGQTAKSRALTHKRVTNHRNAPPVTDVTHGALPDKIEIAAEAAATRVRACRSESERTMPSELESPAVRKAWGEWCDYCAEKNGGRMPAFMTMDAHLKELMLIGAAQAPAAIANAISLGLRKPCLPFTPGGSSGKQQPPQQPPKKPIN